MKTKVTLLVAVIVVFLLNGAQGQVSPKFYGKAEDFKAMAKRTLVVELLEENPKIIAKLSKKEKKAKELADYQAFISDYNTMMQDAVAKYWTFNASIEYMTATEVDELLKAKNKKYALLTYFELGDSDVDFFDRSGLTVPALMYHRMEQPKRQPDYKMYFPSSYVRTDSKYLDCDYKFALTLMQENIKWIISNNKILHFNTFTEKIAGDNCSKLKSKTLLVEKSFLYKSCSAAEAKEAFGKNIRFVDADEINTSFTKKTKGEAVLFTIPYGIMKSSAIVVSVASLTYFKVIVDCETGEVLWVHNPGNMPMGENVSYQLMKNEFKNMAACKM